MTGGQDGERQARTRRAGRIGAIVALVAGLTAGGIALVLALGGGPGDASGPTSSSTPAATTTTGPAAPSPSGSSDSAASAPPADVPLTTSPGGAGEVPTFPLDAAAGGTDGVRVAVTGLRAVDGTSGRPGEVAGPAIRAVITITNGTDAELDLTRVVLNAYAGADGIPVDTLSGPDPLDLPQRLAPGATATAAVIWAVPVDLRDPFRIEADGLPDLVIVAFQGVAP